jgi:hypothetical protein
MNWLSTSIAIFLALIYVPFGNAVLTESKCLTYFDEALQISKQAGTVDKLLVATTDISSMQVGWMKRVGIDTKAQVPNMVRAGNIVKIGSSHTLKIIDCEKGQYEIDGKSFVYNPSYKFIHNYYAVVKEFAKKKSAAADIFRQLIPEAMANSPGINPELNDWYDPRTWNMTGERTDVSPQEESGFGVLLSGVTHAGLMVTGITPISYAIYKTQALAAPSCTDQIRQLSKVLSANKLRLSEIDCSYHLRYSDRSVSFVNQAGAVDKVYADWDVGMAWFNTNRVYRFNSNELTEVRSTSSNKGFRKLVAGSQEFDEEKAKIDPYRQVIKYLGDNKSCYKCEDELNSALAATKDGKGASDPASTK